MLQFTKVLSKIFMVEHFLLRQQGKHSRIVCGESIEKLTKRV